MNVVAVHELLKGMVKSFRTGKDVPASLKQAISDMESRMFSAFRFNPSFIEWCTSNHPDYSVDKPLAISKDAGGFIKGNRVYLDLDQDADHEEFAAHEMGHFLDRYLGGGKWFSEERFKNQEFKTRNSPKEAFAMMVAYVLQDGHTGGPVQSKMYQAVCDELGMKNTLKPGM